MDLGADNRRTGAARRVRAWLRANLPWERSAWDAAAFRRPRRRGRGSAANGCESRRADAFVGSRGRRSTRTLLRWPIEAYVRDRRSSPEGSRTRAVGRIGVKPSRPSASPRPTPQKAATCAHPRGRRDLVSSCSADRGAGSDLAFTNSAPCRRSSTAAWLGQRPESGPLTPFRRLRRVPRAQRSRTPNRMPSSRTAIVDNARPGFDVRRVS